MAQPGVRGKGWATGPGPSGMVGGAEPQPWGPPPGLLLPKTSLPLLSEAPPLPCSGLFRLDPVARGKKAVLAVLWERALLHPAVGSSVPDPRVTGERGRTSEALPSPKEAGSSGQLVEGIDPLRAGHTEGRAPRGPGDSN